MHRCQQAGAIPEVGVDERARHADFGCHLVDADCRRIAADESSDRRFNELRAADLRIEPLCCWRSPATQAAAFAPALALRCWP